VSVGYSFHEDSGGVSRLLHDPGGPYGQWLTRVGNQVVNAAVPKANVDTGLMRSRIEFWLDTESGVLVGYVAARTDYSLYVHEGHGSYGGNPFLTDALREVLGGL
jgi:hypothetical protein